LIAAASQIGREDNHRIDDERFCGVINSRLEANRTSSLRNVAAGHNLFHSVHLLVKDRSSKTDLRGTFFELKIPVRLEDGISWAVKAECHIAQSCTRLHDEVVFEQPRMTVKDKVDSRIDIFIFDICKLRDTYVPLRGIGAEEIIAATGNLFKPGQFRLWVRACQLHAEYSRRNRRVRVALEFAVRHHPERAPRLTTDY